MDKEGFLKKFLAVLIIILLGLVSYGGIYVKNKNIMKNVLPDFSLGMDLDTNTIIKLNVVKDNENSSEENSNEEKSNEANENGQAQNSENIYTVENYRKSKEVLENRFKTVGVKQYNVRLDEQSGSLVVEIPEKIDEKSISNIFVVGKTEIKLVKEKKTSDDTEKNEGNENNTDTTEEILGDAKNIKKATAEIDDSYKSYGIGSFVKLDLEFDNEITKKFKEMKNNYVKPSTEDENASEDSIVITIDGSTICSMAESNFLEYASNGTLPLKLGDYTNDSDILKDTLDEAISIKVIVENENLPVKYFIDYSNDIHSNISKIGIVSVFAVIFAVMFIYLLIRYKLKGILAGLCVIGFEALLLLVLRFTNVQISIAAIVSMVAMLIVQFIYLIQLLNNELNTKVFNNKTINFTKMIIQ